MNYRHAFHAGNFADLLKHATLLWLMQALRRQGAPLVVLDTHAGRGLYDLGAEGARSREAEAGIARLEGAGAHAMPAPLAVLAEAVRGANPQGGVRWYPGSPWLVARAMKPGDRLTACELRQAEHEALEQVMGGFAGVTTLHADGYDRAAIFAAGAPGAERLVLIDPPFERPDDYQRCAEAARRLGAGAHPATVAIWLPLKDLETFDSFLRGLGEPLAARALVVELRLRPLTNPMMLNGCVMVVLNAPEGAAQALAPVCDWLARELGDAGARGEVWSPGD